MHVLVWVFYYLHNYSASLITVILTLKVKFPPDGFITPASLSQLEQLFPPRQEVIVPEDAEEVDLVKLDPEEESRRRRSQAVRNKLVLPPKHQKGWIKDFYVRITNQLRKLHLSCECIRKQEGALKVPTYTLLQ